MAASQKNFTLFTYVDDGAVNWNIRGELDAVRNAVDGSAAAGGHPPFVPSRRHEPRKIVYRDATTFRTKTLIIYTAAAFAAITVGSSTLSFPVEGETAAVTYTATKKIGERNPSATPGGNLADHA
jgi:hypothetical protein